MKVYQITLTLPLRTTTDLEPDADGTIHGYSHFRVGGSHITRGDTGEDVGNISAAITGGVFINAAGGEEYYLDPRDLWDAFSKVMEDGPGDIVEDPYNHNLGARMREEEPEEDEPEPTPEPVETMVEMPKEGHRKVYLEVSSWVGTSAIGAQHYYGWLRSGDQEEQVKRVLTEAEAARLNKAERRMGRDEYAIWKPGDECPAFLDKEPLIAAAMASWKTLYPHADILVLGQRVVAEPQRILAGPKDVMDRVNDWYDEMEWNEYDPHALQDIGDDFREYWRALGD